MTKHEFVKAGKHVIEETIKKFDEQNTKDTFKICAEAFLDEFKAYLFERKEG